MELDLALDAGSVGLTSHEPSDLLDASGWHSRLHAWIEVVRSDSTLHCPDLVRRAEEVSLGLRFSDDATVRELNATWRQRDEATDVLSFAALDDAPAWLDDASVELGDIVISLDTARRQALDHGHSLQRELAWLASHGLLHLLGWDHPDDSSLAAMLRCQEQLLALSIPTTGGNVSAEGLDAAADNPTSDAH